MVYCLRSFVQTLEEVLHPDQHHKKWVLDHDKIPQIQSLFEKGTFLRDFLDNSSPLMQYKIASLEDQIMDAAEKAEDALESYITTELVSSPEGQAFTLSPPNLEEAIQAFEDAKQQVIKIMDAKPVQRSDDNRLRPVSTTLYPNHNKVVVGVTEDLIQLRSRLTSRAPELDIIPIVGMGGIGKTTLARILYDEFSSTHFDCFAWVTISQSYDTKLILRTLLASVTRESLDKISHEQTTSELIVTLYKTLFGRRYLIVVDDIWSCEAWDDVQRAFPRDNKKSRIILTTREKTMVDYVNSKCHEMRLINKDESWELLRGKVFGEESCPRELEEVGKKIADSCGGLPLALQVIGGLLSDSQKSLEFWMHVAQNIYSLIAETDDQFSGIFSWSFAQLPHYLKPCFLYMAGFQEDEAISASKIIKLWVSEGFLYPVRDKSLEEAARIHLNALADRNLIFVRERGRSGRVKSFGIHDLLWDLCLRKVQEKFKDLQTDKEKMFLFRDLRFGRIVSIHTGEYPIPMLTPFTRSLRSYGYSSDTIMSCLCFKLSLLRVLYLRSLVFDKFPRVILQLVNLRYLNIFTMEFIPVSISVLRNLQTLIAYRISSLAMISDMPQLRHLKFKFVYTKEESSELVYGVHENLQSLSIKLRAIEVGKLLGKLPNLRKLTIFDARNDEEFIDLTCFHYLETLHCREVSSYSHNMTFPVSLKKLTLKYCNIGESDLNAICALPSLQILVITYSYPKMDWDLLQCEGGFYALRYLEFNGWELENWLATEVHFPVLEHLVLKNCHRLVEIPVDFVDIATLNIIEVDRCLLSVFDSARRIYEEQSQFGNTDLQLQLGVDTEESNKQAKE